MTAGRYDKWNESWRPEAEVQNIGDRRSEDVGQRIQLENQRTGGCKVELERDQMIKP
jgi:hypothetical protein